MQVLAQPLEVVPFWQLREIISADDEGKVLLRSLREQLAQEVAGVSAFISLCVPDLNRSAKILRGLLDEVQGAKVVNRFLSQRQARIIIQNDVLALEVVVETGNQDDLVHRAEAEHFFGKIEMTIVDGVKASAENGICSFEKVFVGHLARTLSPISELLWSRDIWP